ncbi:MAG: OB-fold nucleic acid binding domain-containing protein [Candidatus Thorarchaeota archaeon]|jgi:hypothetical protein
MRRRKELAAMVVVITITATLSLTFIYFHDYPYGATPMSAMGTTPIGTNVTVRGEITDILSLHMGLNDQFVTVSDGSDHVKFYWHQTRLEVGWIVVVRGTVSGYLHLHPVESVDRVWLFP